MGACKIGYLKKSEIRITLLEQQSSASKGHLLAKQPELLRELLEEEREKLLINGLVHVVLPLGHVPGCGVGWHHIVGKHLETGTTGVERTIKP